MPLWTQWTQWTPKGEVQKGEMESLVVPTMFNPNGLVVPLQIQYFLLRLLAAVESTTVSDCIRLQLSDSSRISKISSLTAHRRGLRAPRASGTFRLRQGLGPAQCRVHRGARGARPLEQLLQGLPSRGSGSCLVHQGVPRRRDDPRESTKKNRWKRRILQCEAPVG